MKTATQIAAILLAAGSSSRLGRPKQLVEFDGETLIRRAANALIDAGCEPVVVVLGSEIELSKKHLTGLDVRIAENAVWQTGMSSSIREGMSHVILENVDAVLISVCDQPNVRAEHLQKLITRSRETHAAVTAAEYNNILGVPAVFGRELFDDLMNLTGDKGARDLIREGAAVSVPIPEAALDIDTKSDLAETRV